MEKFQPSFMALILQGNPITGGLLPTLQGLVSGANNIIRTYVKPDLEEGTRALLNPILEAMLARCKFDFQSIWILFTTRLALRSKHVCITE